MEKKRADTIPPFPTSIFVHLVIIKWLLETRYLAPRIPIPASTKLRDKVLDEYDSDRFRDIMRPSRERFDQLVTLIAPGRHYTGKGECVSTADAQGDPERGIASTESVFIQLKIALFRLGMKGISSARVAWIMGRQRRSRSYIFMAMCLCA